MGPLGPMGQPANGGPQRGLGRVRERIINGLSEKD
jgi:hypothetical protein